LLAQVEQMKQGREIVYGFLGVTVSDPTGRDRNNSGVKDGGAKIDAIEEKSPADGTPLKRNDVITAVNGQMVADSDGFIRMIGRSQVDQPAKLTVFRDRKSLEVTVTPKRRPMPPLAVNRETQRLRWRGITLSSVPQNWAKPGETGAPAGVYVIGVENAEAGKKLGVKQGSIITAIAGKAVRSIADLQEVLARMETEDPKLEIAADAAIATAQE
jgi:S1-C subfamily serine protease